MASKHDRGSATEAERDEELPALRQRIAELEQQIAGMFSDNQAIKLLIDPEDGAIVSANPAAARFYGYSTAELETLLITDLNQLPMELVQRELDRARLEERTYFEFKHRLKSGELRDVQVYSGPCRVGDRTLLFSILVDITERNRLAEALAQAQRMESLGRLASGIAHDFNNLLTTMDLLRSVIDRRIRRERDASDALADLQSTVAHGAALTGQLLAFCRRQPVDPVLLDLAEVVGDFQRMMRRLLPDAIEVHMSLCPSAPIIADHAQIENILLNLALNAADAMPDGGHLTIAVSEEDLSEAVAARLDMAPGQSLALRFTDTGEGIPSDIIDRVFEPFFTTKEPGKGTGLGLATVYGISRQWRGAVEIASERGSGTSVTVRWPRAPEEPATLPAKLVSLDTLSGTETVFVVEDEDSNRAVIAGLLGDFGYQVLEASNGQEALQRSQSHDGPIHLLLTDVIMPRMGGPQLARAIAYQRPEVRVLYMSGHVDIPGVDLGLAAASAHILTKPFNLDQMLAMVRSVLDEQT